MWNSGTGFQLSYNENREKGLEIPLQAAMAICSITEML